MQAKIKYIPVIMHPYSSFSNGTSILAPRRIELFPKQPISLETNEFVPQLIIHEVRHFAQMDQLNAGITKVASYILGEQAQSLVLGLHVPKWLLEGDAVLTETLLSHAGRGRIAGFIQPLRSRLIDKKDMSWDRVNFGSFRETLPNEYLIGYFLTARGRMLADPLLWSDALKQIGKNPFNIKGLSGLTWPKTGYRFSQLYLETLDWLYDYWTDPSLTVKNPEGLINIARATTEFCNYYRPQQVSPDEIICLKTTLGDLPAFVIIDSAESERIITRPGFIEDAGFSYSHEKLVWTELVQDPRWENRSWSEIFMYDLKTDRKKRLTRGVRYFSPVFSPEGDRIAVINELADGLSLLLILDPIDGRIIHSIPADGNAHFSYLCWGSRPDELFAITTGAEGRMLIHIDCKLMVRNTLLKAGMTDITSPSVFGDWIYFAGPAGATQGLFRLNRITLAIQKVFSHTHGINYLSTQGRNLFLSVYSSNGFRPAKIAFDNLKGKPVSHLESLKEPVTSIIQRAADEFPIVYSDSVQTFDKVPYKKFSHLLRLHSWSPLFLNPDSYQISPGMVLMSQNDLSTMTFWAGYQYIKSDLSHNLVAAARYTGLYPSLELDFNRKYLNHRPESDSTGMISGAYQQLVRIGAGLPFSLSSGAWSRKIQPTIFFEQFSYLQEHQSEFDRSAWMAGLSLSTHILRKTSYRDLFPEWGFSMNLSLFKAFNRQDRTNNLTGRIIVYLPGLLPNSSLRILNSVSKVNIPQFYSSILQDFPRGLAFMNNQSYNLKIDYAFPISYPDYHLSWLIYIKRIKANLFFDAATPLRDRNWEESTGIDLSIDYHLLRIGIVLESGIRMMYFPARRKIGAEFLFAFSAN